MIAMPAEDTNFHGCMPFNPVIVPLSTADGFQAAGEDQKQTSCARMRQQF
jgi:hypothetical protein